MVKRVLTSLLILLIAFTLTLGAAAAANLEAVTAYLNRTLSIEYNGEDIGPMFDVLGEQVYPITYNGTTYLPLRAIAETLDVPVDYDDETRTVSLGSVDTSADLIDDLKPYAGNYNAAEGIVMSVDGKTRRIAGESVDHWLYFDNCEYFYYDLGGDYSTLTLTAYCPDSRVNDRFDLNISCDGELVGEFQVPELAPPQQITIDVSGVRELYICGRSPDGDGTACHLYIYDAALEP